MSHGDMGSELHIPTLPLCPYFGVESINSHFANIRLYYETNSELMETTVLNSIHSLFGENFWEKIKNKNTVEISGNQE